jgi:riboflavin kinase / FMN adenylyltransferase
VSQTTLWGPETPSIGTAVAAIGVFDGVHVGHQALITDAVGIARARGVSSAVVTFDRDPDQVVSPAGAAPQLLDLTDKLEFLAEAGPDVILVIPFDEHIAALAPLAFLDEVLLRAVAPEALVVGYDFRFGHRAEGDVDALVRYGADHGFTVVAHDLVRLDGEPVTSTRIRRMVAAGDVAGAARLLGRPHRVRGTVGHGRALGHELGAPTANLQVGVWAALPADGVYAGRVHTAEGAYAAGIAVGRPPTFPESEAVLEAHLIAYEGVLYDTSLTVEFVERLRDQRRFDTREELAAAIAADLRVIERLVTAG